MRRWGRTAIGGLGMVGVLALAQPALADQAVTVRGTAMPAGAGLAHVGCGSPYAASGAFQPYVGQGPSTPPLGERSLGLAPGADAVGPVAYTSSLAGVSVASVSVAAPAGTAGVAYVGYQDPADAGTSHLWFGRSTLDVPAGGWSEVSAIGRTFSWTQYDARTGEVLAGGPTATVDSFVGERGDGPGLYALAVGCDAGSTDVVNVDAFRFGAPGDVTTYDFEGLETAISMIGNHATLTAGETIQLTGSLWATGGVTLASATAVLERRDQGTWQTVRVVDAGSRTSAIIEPPSSGTYRWRFADRPLAEGSTSSTFVIDVAASVTARAEERAVTGRVAPGVAGSTVNLRPVEGGGILASATTTADGSYTISLDGVGAGRYVVVTPGSETNLRGQSAVVSVEGEKGEPAPSTKPTPAAGPTKPAAPSEPTKPAEPAQPAPSAKPSAPSAPSPSASAPTAAPQPSTPPTSAPVAPSAATEPSPAATPSGSPVPSP